MSDNPTSFELPELEVATPSALEAIARADINQQIATAKRYPRELNFKKHTERMVAMAAYSTEAAAECFYAIPRGGLTIYGPSVRLSEILAYEWGNLYSVSRILDVNVASRLVTAQAIAWDLEANVKEGIEYTQRITVKGEEGIKVACLAAVAMAGRNAKLKVIPRIVWWPVYERCLAVARGSVVPLGTRLAEAIKAFAIYGITPDRILAKFSYEALNQITEEDLQALRGFYTAIKEEASSPEAIFPPISEKDTVQSANQPVDTTPATASGPGAEPATPRRRGRPPRSKRSDASDTVAQTVGNSPGPVADSPNNEGRGNSGLDQTPPTENVLPFPEPEADSKTKTVAQLRDLIATSQKSEQGLMAKLQEWGFAKNLDNTPITLEDYPENTLIQIVTRWEKLAERLPTRTPVQ